jgi:hypothetical protein
MRDSIEKTLEEKSGKKESFCICGVHKGWVCVAPEFEGSVFSDWPEHSIGCEMFTKRKEREVQEKKDAH